MGDKIYCGKCLFTYHPKLREVTHPNGKDSTSKWCIHHGYVRSGFYMGGTDAITKDEIKKRLKSKRDRLDRIEKAAELEDINGEV